MCCLETIAKPQKDSKESKVQAQAKNAALAIGKIAHVNGKMEDTSVQWDHSA